MRQNYDGELLRDTILGTIKWHACPMCSGTGYQNWDENGEDIKAGRSSRDDRESGECDNCEGLGFITREEL